MHDTNSGNVNGDGHGPPDPIESESTPLADQLIDSATELVETLRSGTKLEDKYTMRAVRLDLDPRSFSGDDVRSIRSRLNCSQAVFAQLIGVSASLVQAWERDAATPTGPAARLLEVMNVDPEPWRVKLREAYRQGEGQDDAD